MSLRAIIFGLLIGAGCGVVFDRWSMREHATNAALGSQELINANTRLQTENRLLQRKLEETTGPARAQRRAQTPTDSLAVLARLYDQSLVRFTTPLIDRKGQLSDSFVRLFGLGPSDKARLQSSIETARANLAALSQRHAQVTSKPDGTLSVMVPPFPVEGGQVYDQLMRGFEHVLGKERNGYFTAMYGDQLDQPFAYFGAAEHTYTFGYDVSSRPGQPYTLVDEVSQRTPHEGGNGYSNNTRFETYDELSAYVGPIITLLPPTYRRGETPTQ